LGKTKDSQIHTYFRSNFLILQSCGGPGGRTQKYPGPGPAALGEYEGIYKPAPATYLLTTRLITPPSAFHHSLSTPAGAVGWITSPKSSRLQETTPAGKINQFFIGKCLFLKKILLNIG